MKYSTLNWCFVFLAKFELTSRIHPVPLLLTSIDTAIRNTRPKPIEALSKLNRIQANLVKTATKPTYPKILRGYNIFSIFECNDNKTGNIFKIPVFFKMVSYTASIELFLWTMISAAICYKFLQVYWSISRNSYDLYKILFFLKAALNPIFSTKVIDGSPSKLSQTLQ